MCKRGSQFGGDFGHGAVRDTDEIEIGSKLNEVPPAGGGRGVKPLLCPRPARSRARGEPDQNESALAKSQGQAGTQPACADDGEA